VGQGGELCRGERGKLGATHLISVITFVINLAGIGWYWRVLTRNPSARKPGMTCTDRYGLGPDVIASPRVQVPSDTI
jgi:hypothetical protein